MLQKTFYVLCGIHNFHVPLGIFQCVNVPLYLLTFFIVYNLKKTLSGSRLITMRHFWAQNIPVGLKKNFSGKKCNFNLPLVKIFKKSLEWIQNYDKLMIFEPNMPTSPGQDFFEKKN